MRLSDPRTFNQYAYVAGNPLLFVDPVGLTIAVTGRYKTELITMLSQEMGLRVYEDSTGNLTREQGPPVPTSAALVAAFDEAASSETPAFTVVAEGDIPYSPFDSYCCMKGQESPTISVTNLQALPSSPSAERPDEATRGEFLSHILAEYASGAKLGSFTMGPGGTYDPSHRGPAMNAQNAFRAGRGQSKVTWQGPTSEHGIYIEFESGKAERFDFSESGAVSEVHYGSKWASPFWW